jgi:hypothetical protein
MTTSVPKITFPSTGIVLPQETDILAGVQADINSAFGGGVNPNLVTPQGQIAQSETAIIGDKNNQIAEIVNQVNPDFSDGRWQDAIGRIYFLDRISASGTVVTGRCIGLVGTVIPQGSSAQDTNGYIYQTTSAATIPSTGFIDIQFQNLTTGPIPCAIGALNRIYIKVNGWDTVSNPAAGSIGVDVESRADFEFRRRASVAINAANTVQSIYGAVLNLPNVIDAFVVDNPLGTSITYGATSYSMLPHSIVASVAGGANSDIAQAIWNNKSGGCDYNGNTTGSVVDQNYLDPKPTYTVKWLTPTATQAFFAVQITNNPNLPSTIVTLIKNSIIAAFNGEDGGARARIGSTTYAGRYYAGVAATDANVQILSILMGTSTGARTFTSIAFGIDQLPTIDATNISVTLV